MSLAQEIILYFEIIPLIMFLIYAVIKSYIEEQKCLRKQIWKLKKTCRKIEEKYEKQEFLREIKRGLSTGIDKPNYRNVLN